MKSFDCFLFSSELDLLELRLNILDNCVDHFVIVESGVTFQGEDKEFVFEKHRNRFSKFMHKIIYFKVEKYTLEFANLPYIDSPQNLDEKILNKIYQFVDDCRLFDKNREFWWGNDFFQRECIWRGLAVANAKPYDFIILSDLDEIPNPETIASLKNSIAERSLVCLRQHEFYYYLNYYHDSEWLGTCCFLCPSLASVSLNAIRFSAKRDEGLFPEIIDNGGWHFTNIGGAGAIRKKIQSWGHREFNTRATLSSVEYNVRHGYDIFRRPGFGRLRNIPLESRMLPAFLVDHAKEYEHLLGPEIEKETFLQWAVHISYFYLRSKANSAARRIREFFRFNSQSCI